MAPVIEARSGDQLRASRRRRMADNIELAALRLFAEYGIDEVTVDDIAGAADISRRTFFRYFSSKDDVLLGDPERQLEIVRAAVLDEPPQASSFTLLRSILLALVAESERRREAVLLRTRIVEKNPEAFARGQSRRPSLVDPVVHAVATRMRVDPETDLKPRVYVHAGFGAIHAAFQLWLASGAQGSLEKLVAGALDLILPKGNPPRDPRLPGS